MLKRVLGLLFLLPTFCFAADYIEGKDYQIVTPSSSATKSNNPTVTEFFSFGCPSCYKMEIPFNQWVASLGGQVTIQKVPVVFKPDWELYAKAYYTEKTLALTKKMTPDLFSAIQEGKTPLNTPAAMTAFFVKHGVDREIAKSAFEHSPTIDLQVKNGMNLLGEYQITAVPAFVINSKYKTDLQMTGSPERLFEVMGYLLKKG